jgi:hypothetical protein
MNDISWWGAVLLSALVVVRAWQNLFRANCPRLKRRIYLAVFWFTMALGLPICTILVVPLVNRWAWLLVALATNGFLMMACDCLFARRDVSPFSQESRK